MLIFILMVANLACAQTPYRLTLDNVSLVNMKILDSAMDIDVHAMGTTSGVAGVEIRFGKLGFKPAEEILRQLDISQVSSHKLVISAPDEVTIQIRFPQIATYHNRLSISTRSGEPLLDLFNRLHGGKVVMLTMSRPYNWPCPSDLTVEAYNDF